MTVLKATVAVQALIFTNSVPVQSRERVEIDGKWKDLGQKLQNRRAKTEGSVNTVPQVANDVLQEEKHMFQQLEAHDKVANHHQDADEDTDAADFVQTLMHKHALKCTPSTLSDEGRLSNDNVCPPAFDCIPNDNELGGICVPASTTKILKGLSSTNNKKRLKPKPHGRKLKGGAKSVNDDASKKTKKGKKSKSASKDKSGKNKSKGDSNDGNPEIPVPNNCITGSSVEVIASCTNSSLNCCIGANDTLYGTFYQACNFEYATVCPNSCNGAAACYLLADQADYVVIFEGGCVGEFACYNLTAVVGEDSCGDVAACAFAVANIGNYSCNAGYACAGSNGEVGDDACNGYNACLNNTGSISTFSCNGNQACLQNDGDIGVSSCNGNQTCLSNDGDIGTASCLGYRACFANTGQVGNYSCRGDNACSFANGNVDTYACNGQYACFGNNGTVNRNACNAGSACQNNVNTIPNRTCNLESSCIGGVGP